MDSQYPCSGFGGPVRAQLAGYLKDWRGFLLGQLPQAQQALRRLVKGRLKFTPHENGYTFEGVGTLLPLLGGVVRNLASPRGYAPWWKRIVWRAREVRGLAA